MNATFPTLASLTTTSDTLVLPPIKMAAHIFGAANLLVPDLARGRRITAAALRSTIETACGGSDADGAWIWRGAYEACEAAQVLFLRKYGRSMRRQAATPAAFLAMLARVAALLPTQTRRSEDSQALKQFSTPLELGFAAAHAADIAEDGRGALRLADGLQLRRVRVMNDHRIEPTGLTEGMRARLRAMGLFSEIIAWKLRFFVPVGAAGLDILASLLKRHPLTGVADRDAA